MDLARQSDPVRAEYTDRRRPTYGQRRDRVDDLVDVAGKRA
jgi:hypothetical protein